MNQNATPGTNRTGIAMAPERSQEMLMGMEEFPPNSQGSALDAEDGTPTDTALDAPAAASTSAAGAVADRDFGTMSCPIIPQ